MRASIFLVFFGFLALGCTAPGGSYAGTEQEVVYGTDDRDDVYAYPDMATRNLVHQSIVALIPSSALVTVGPGSYGVNAATLDEAWNLCSGERFATQPTAASCSGTLIDDDLVLTAGHCATSLGDCQSYRYVFDYYYQSNGVLAPIDANDVYTCAEIVVRAETGGLTQLDYAVIRLDRAATPAHTPARVATTAEALTVGDPITVIGFGSGLPAKIDDGGEVTSTRPLTLDYFVGSPDTFGGNSGSGVFDSTGLVVGILVRGNEDYVSAGTCTRVNVLSESQAGEDMTYAGRAIEALCASASPSTRLCGAACGNLVCELGETRTNCATDCATGCGDGDCAAGEDTTCPSDCTTVPPGWTCPLDHYDAGDGCDCACGAVDPDCDDSDAIVYGCDAGFVCNRNGNCVRSKGGRCDVATPATNVPLPGWLAAFVLLGVAVVLRRLVRVA